MTAYGQHTHNHSTPLYFIAAMNKAAKRKILEEVFQRRRENYKRFIKKRLKDARDTDTIAQLMTSEELKQLGEVIDSRLDAKLKPIKEKITTIKQQLASTKQEITTTKQAIEASEKRLIQKINESQEDTIKVLSDLIHTGYNMHEERIARIEEHLDIPHPHKN